MTTPRALKALATIALASLLVSAGKAIAQDSCAPTVVGDLRIEHFPSTMQARDITVRVWLPAGYDSADSIRHYPTLYFLDGQTAFDDCTAFKGEKELRLDEAVTELIATGAIPAMIVVGVDSGGRRHHEYAPYNNPLTEPSAPEPAGKLLPRFFAEELMPFVAARYRVSRNAAHTGIGGTSLGAAAALWVSLNRPDLFGLALLQSPSLLLGNGQLLRDTMQIARAPDRVAIGVGSTELDFPDIEKFLDPVRLTRSEAERGGQRMTERLAEHLRAAYVKTPDVLLVVEPGANHSSRYWAGRLPAAIQFLYKTTAQK